MNEISDTNKQVQSTFHAVHVLQYVYYTHPEIYLRQYACKFLSFNLFEASHQVS